MHKLTFAAAAALVLISAGSARAEIDLKNFDLSVKPQDDFYHYANGTWLKNNPVPPAFSKWGAFYELRDQSTANLHKICESAAAKTEGATSIEKMVGDFYASGMDEAAIEAAGAKPLQAELDRIATIKTPSDVLATLAHLHAIGVSAGFYFGSSADDKNSSQELAYLYQGGLGLPERGYYFKTDDKSQKLRQEYVTHVGKMLTLLGESAEDAQTDAAAVMSLETKLALHSLSRVELRDPYASYHKMSLTKAEAEIPGVPLQVYLANTTAPAFDEINLSQPGFFKGFETALTTVSIADWQAYLRWHLVSSAAPYLSKAFVEENFAFYGHTLSGTPEMKPRWKRVVSTVDGSIGDALGQLYVAEYFPPTSKAQMLQLVHNLQSSLGNRIEHLSWMDEATRTKALAKLSAFTVKIGYPDKWKDYSSVAINRDSYFTNIMHARAYERARNLRKIGGPVDRSEWHMNPQTVNAYYNPSNNEIVFPAAILQPPFFDPKADPAVNYGAIGVVIGHEMTHGFDDQGRRYDANGNLTDWWTKESAEKFKTRAAEIIKQFSGYTVLDGLHVNGELTQGENIADLGGLLVSYGAMEHALQGQPRAKVDGFTPEQRFFLSYATIWRTNMRPEAARLQVNTDPHSPAQFRANGPLSNLPTFYKAFDIPEGSAMRRPADERVAIW